jgi:uncharacterized protein YbaA (DUF1428 family)
MALNLLSVYEDMLQKQAAANDSELSSDEQEVLNKYAELAVENLTEEVGEGNFTEEDVVKVASAYIEADQALIEEQEALDKYAELAVEALAEEVGEGNFTEEDVVKVAEALIENDQAMIAEAEELLDKYAELAVEALAEEVGEGNFTEEDVVKVAEALIENDQEIIEQALEEEQEEAVQKVAEAHELGTIMADAFLTRLSNE